MSGTAKRYWFARSAKGLRGRTPVSWQGWTAFTLYLLIMLTGVGVVIGLAPDRALALVFAFAWAGVAVTAYMLLTRMTCDPERSAEDYWTGHVNRIKRARGWPVETDQK